MLKKDYLKSTVRTFNMFKTGPEPRSFDQVVDILLANSLENTQTGCLLWQGRTIGSGEGYGVICWQGKETYIHRLIFEQYHGFVTEVVRHSCDRSRCWNIDHLLGGTHGNNVQDKVDRDRHLYGNRHPSSKLTESIVREIRASPLSVKELTLKYNVSRGAIHCILKFETWKHVI